MPTSAMVQHRQPSLLHDFSQLGVFDLIFCRNVLIYFDQQTKTSVLNRLAKVIEADGFLMLGAAETVFGLTNVFKPMAERRAVYQPNEVPAASVRTSAFVAPASAVTATARI
jgi:chemotaxis protein methyltransferase CheR